MNFMYFINSCKKINFSFFLFIIVSAVIASAVFGAISSSASSDSSNAQNQSTKAPNLLAERRSNPLLDTAATFLVSNLNDSGAGSLRKAVADANVAGGNNTISFNAGLTGTITLTTGEIEITSNILISKSGDRLPVSGNNASRVFKIASGAGVTISNLSVVNGKAEGSGGGILNAGSLELLSSTVSGNTAVYTGTTSGTANGGGISNSGTLIIETSTVGNNTASVANLGTANGGGIANTGTVTISNSSVITNNAIGKPDAQGGGIFNNGMLTLINSTVGNNSAASSSASANSRGGGIYNAMQLTIRNSTVGFNAANAASAEGGGIFIAAGTVIIANTIVSNSTTVNNGTTTVRDISGMVTSEGNNLISNATGSTGWAASDKLNQPSFITPLGNYGGPTQTFALLPNSPAIDAGNNTNAPANDQRGSARIVGGTIDIGSFENNPAGLVAAIPNGAVGAPYNQNLATSPSTLTFALVGGALPPGLNLSASGAITGTPTTGGAYNFSVSTTNTDSFVNYKQYSIFIPFAIVNLNDSGVGSLRRAIIDANSAPGDDTLTFQSGLNGTLTLLSELSITSNITIVGTGANNLIINGNGVTRVFNIAANTNVGISGLTVRNGSVEGSGAGILNAGTLGLTNVIIHDNTAVYSGTVGGTVGGGGGISNSGTLSITTSTIRSNTAQVTNLGTASGGGISNNGTVTLINSTVSSNNSLGKPTANGGGISNNGTFNIVNSTVGNNTASASPAASGSQTGQGGGIWNGAQGVLTVRNTTIGFNSVNAATAAGGGVFNAGTLAIGNTIVSDSKITSNSGITVRDVSGAVASEGNNLISDATSSTGWAASDILNQPGLLTPLGNYGGPTQTFGILPSSPAINRGSNTNAPATDQRGSARIVGGTIDIGSFENNPTGVKSAISNGAVGTPYTQTLANSQPSTLTFALVTGSLPPGLNLATDGAITGTPTTGGTFNFGVSITDPNGAVNFQEFALIIGCTYSISPTSVSFTNAGGAGSFDVITQNGCFYTVSGNNASIITITSPPTGSGSGKVNFTVSANTGPARTGSVTVAGLTFTVTQSSGCAYTLSPTSSTFAPAGGVGSFNVITGSQCVWAAATTTSWITINSGSGTGSGMVNFTVQPNNGPARSGTIIVEGQIYTVNQSSGCTYLLNPATVSIASGGGTGSFTITTTSICTYTAVSSVSWVTINSGGTGAGNGTVSYTVTANTGAARTGTINIGGELFTVNQAGGCTYSISAASVNIGQTGGTGSVNVTAGTGCEWTAVSNVPWITITSGATGTGNGTVSFTVAANSGAPRTGTLTIAGQTFTVNQAGCEYILSPSSTTFSAAGGSGSFTVTVTAGCAYTAVSNASWISIVSGSAGSGNGTVTFTVEANVGPQRTGTITVNGVIFTLTQTGGCNYSIFPTSVNIPGTASTGSFNLNAGGGCQYTVVSNAAWITITSPASGNGSGLITFSAQANPGAARSGTITVGGQTFTVNQAAAGAGITRPAFDFDGDGKSDISVFRPNGGNWYLLQSQAGFTGIQFGISSDKIVPADFDGDGKTDIAVYRAGVWYINRSNAGFIGFGFGAPDDVPQPADFDGDGKAELVVWRPSNGTWYVYNLATNQFTSAQFGATTDKPVVGDYDGDNKADLAVFRPSNGTWYLQRSQLGFTGLQFGDAADKPVPADYDGDRKTDIAVFRPSNGTWYLNRSQLGFTGMQFGISTDLPVPADYDGDGKSDIAVFRDGTWYLQQTTAGFTGIQFGAATDKPAPNAFIP